MSSVADPASAKTGSNSDNGHATAEAQQRLFNFLETSNHEIYPARTDRGIISTGLDLAVMPFGTETPRTKNELHKFETFHAFVLRGFDRPYVRDGLLFILMQGMKGVKKPTLDSRAHYGDLIHTAVGLLGGNSNTDPHPELDRDPDWVDIKFPETKQLERGYVIGRIIKDSSDKLHLRMDPPGTPIVIVPSMLFFHEKQTLGAGNTRSPFAKRINDQRIVMHRSQPRNGKNTFYSADISENSMAIPYVQFDWLREQVDTISGDDDASTDN